MVKYCTTSCIYCLYIIIIGNRPSCMMSSVIYPHVYDNLDKSTLNAAIVNDCRIVLPLDSERSNNAVGIHYLIISMIYSLYYIASELQQ